MIFRKIILVVVSVHILSMYWNTRRRLIRRPREVNQVPCAGDIHSDEGLWDDTNTRKMILKALFLFLLCVGIITLWVLRGVELGLSVLMVVEVIWWMVYDWGWEQKGINNMVETRLRYWVEKWVRERGHIFMSMFIWWTLGQPVAAFAVLSGGGLIASLWNRRLRRDIKRVLNQG